MSEQEVNLYEEICCERCGEVIHNHFDCPSCGKDYAGTSIYGPLSEEGSFSCQNCDEEFEIVDKEFSNIKIREKKQ